MPRLALLVLCSPLLLACSSRASGGWDGGPFPTGSGGKSGAAGADGTQYFQQKPNNQIDILFVVDNSPSMEPVQTRLTAGFPGFISALKALPYGLPDVHIGITSTDVGTGQVTQGVPGCSKQPYGDQGALLSGAGWTYTWDTMQGKYTTTRKTCSVPVNKFISATGGVGTEGTTNYTGTLSDTFGCIASIGATGCAFESPLGSMLRALGVDPWFPAPTDNDGFLRPDAYLAIILVSNEDDCSLPPDSILMDPNSRNLSGDFGPLASYRCNRFGHVCDGKEPPQLPTDPQFAGGTSYAPTSCRSSEDGTLLRVADVIDEVKMTKPSADMIFVGALAGPPAPYVVKLDSTLPASSGYPTEQWPKIVPSCSATTGTTSGEPAATADPAVRIKQFVDGMGGVFESVCDDDLGVPLKNLATALGRRLGVQCLARKLRDTDLNTPGLQPTCTVQDRQRNDAGQWVMSTLPKCNDPSGTAPTNRPCWYVTTSPDCPAATGGVVMKVSRTDVNALSAGASIAVKCDECTAGDTTANCAY